MRRMTQAWNCPIAAIVFLFALPAPDRRRSKPLSINRLAKFPWPVDCPLSGGGALAVAIAAFSSGAGKMLARRIWLLTFSIALPALCMASVELHPATAAKGETSLTQRERQVWSSAMHDSEFAAMTPLVPPGLNARPSSLRRLWPRPILSWKKPISVRKGQFHRRH